MLRYQFFPRSQGATEEMIRVIKCFEKVYAKINSDKFKLNSDGVLKLLRPYLEKESFKVETGKTKKEKIPVPVLFGLNNKIDKYFDADAISSDGKIVIEVEAGRAVLNYQFLKDIFQASMMFSVEHLILAVRNDYLGTDDFSKVFSFLETLYLSNRLHMSLKGILLVGY